MASIPVSPPSGPAPDDGLVPGQPVSTPPPEESEWRVGTLAYTRRGLTRLFSWLLWGDLAWSIRDRSIGPVLQFMLQRFKASDTVNNLLVGTFPAAIGLILGPVISFRSDRLRSPRGRRIPFLIFSAPAAALAIIGLGYSPAMGGLLHEALGARSPGYYATVLLVLGAWWIVFDVATTVTNAVFGALINDVVPHGVIGRFYGLFRAVSLIVGAIFGLLLADRAQENFQVTFTVVGAIYGVGVVWMCLKVREGEYPPPEPVAGSGWERSWTAIREYFRRAFTEPYYLWFFLGSSLATISTTPINLNNAAFVKSVGMSPNTFFIIQGCTYLVSLALSYPLGWLCDRFHPLRMSMLVLAVYAVTCLWGGLVATTVFWYGAALLAHTIISGTLYTTTASLSQRLLPRENYAQIASAGGFIGSLFNIVLPLALGQILDRSQHNYRLTYFASAILSLVSLGCLARVYRYWRRHGGPHHFVPPEGGSSRLGVTS